MGDILVPRKDPTDDPFTDDLGGGAYYCFKVPISTAISEGGIGHCAGLHLDVAESFIDRYSLGLEFNTATLDGKLFPSGIGEGSSYDHSHWGLQFGFGRTRKLAPFFTDSGNLAASVGLSTTPMVGGGESTLTNSPVTVDGEEFSFGSRSSRTADLSTTYALPVEIPVKDRFALRFAPALRYGVQYAGAGSEFNRVNLEFLLTLELAGIDASTRGGEDADTELGWMGLAQGLFAMGHGWALRYMMNQTLSGPQEALTDYGILQPSPGGDRASMANVPALEAGSAFLSGAGGSLTPALRGGTGWYWGLLAAQTLGDGLFFLDDNSASHTAAFTGLLKAPRLLGYAIAGIESPRKRLALSNDEVERREMYIGLASYLLNSVILLGGGLGGSDMTAQAAAGANLGISFSPDPTERKTVERTDYSWIPVSVTRGSQSGMRSGILIHKSWHDVPMKQFQLFTSVSLLSPSFRLDNAGNHVDQDHPYGDIGLSSDIDAALGLEWKTTWTRLSFGIDTKAVFGDDDAKAGIGGLLGFDLLIPFNGREDGTGLVIGARTMVHKLFPDGWGFEFMPMIGISLGK